MIKYKEITTSVERKPLFTDRMVTLPRLTNAPFSSEEHEQWVKDNWWMVDYVVFMDHKERAKQLAAELQQAFSENPNHPNIPGILEELKRMKLKSRGEMNPLEIWTRSAYQLAGYAGTLDVIQAIENRLDRYSGTILEAMCGHSSYFRESDKRSVIALDYCRISLERYPYPTRRRIECDLNQVQGKTSLSFFQDEQFDTISICFGFKYPEHISPLMREFRRILRKGGVLSFIENPHHAYEDLCKRQFSKKRVRELLLRNGYRSATIRELRVPNWNNYYRGKFYHVEAIK